MISHPAAGWRIRAYEDRDRADCEEVFHGCVAQFSWMNDPQAVPDAWVDTRRKVQTWVAEVGDNDVVGFIMLSGRTAYVNYLLVETDWRFCGVGQGLLDTARDHAGVPLSLDVDEENTRAIAAYRALGFAPAGRSEHNGRSQIRLESI